MNQPATLTEYRAAMLDPVAVRARAMVLLHGSNRLPDGEPRLRALPPSAPEFVPAPAPPPVWICRPPDWSKAWTVADCPWSGPWKIGRHRYRRGTGRMKGGRATCHGRLDWAASEARYETWRAAVDEARGVHLAEVRAVERAGREAVLDQLRAHCVPVRALRDGYPAGPEAPALCRVVHWHLTTSARRGQQDGQGAPARRWNEDVEAWMVFDAEWLSSGWTPGWLTTPTFRLLWRVVPRVVPDGGAP